MLISVSKDLWTMVEEGKNTPAQVKVLFLKYTKGKLQKNYEQNVYEK